MKNTFCLIQMVMCIALGATLSNCQRASYSFADAGNTGSVAPRAVPASAAVAGAPAALLRMGSLRRSHPLAARPRALRSANRRHRHAAVAKPRPAPRVSSSPVQVARQTAQHKPAASEEPAPERRRSKGIALVLALLFGGFGAHRFYLAYYGQGAAYVGLTALAVLSLALGFLFLAFGSTVSVFLVVGLVLSVLVQGWLIADIVRIITGHLKPKNGEYYPRFFQASPDAKTPPEPRTK